MTLVSRALTNRRPRSSSQIMSSCPITTNFVAFDEQQDGRWAIFPHRLRECLRAKLSPAEFRTRRPSHILTKCPVPRGFCMAARFGFRLAKARRGSQHLGMPVRYLLEDETV